MRGSATTKPTSGQRIGKDRKNAMAFVPAPNQVLVEWRMIRAGQKIENTLHVNMLAEPVISEMTDLAVACWDWWENTLAPLTSVGVLLVSVVVTSLHEADGVQYTYAPDTTTTGEIVGLSLPNEVTLCVSLRSGHRGRSARGRFYVPSLVFDQMLDENNVEAAAVDAFRTALQQLINDVTDLGKQANVVSYRTNNAPRPGGPVYFPYTSAVVVDSIVDSMKSRKPGVGE